MLKQIKIHWQHYWALWVIFLFFLFQFGDVIFSDGTRSTLQNSPGGGVYQIPKYNGVFEGGSLNRFARQHTGARVFWDQPLVNDPVIKASNDILLSGEFPWINPYLGLGIPLFGNGVDSTFFIGSIVMAFLNSKYWDWVYLTLFLISGFLIYQIFHKYYFFEKGASLVGALLYLSSALFAPQMVNGGESFNIYCFTFAIYFVEVFRVAQHRSVKIWSTLAIIFCVTQSAYAAMSEGTVATYIMVCAYMLLRLPLWPIKQMWNTGLWIFVVFSLALLFSSPYLLTLQYNSGFMPHDHYIGHITIPLHYFTDLFLPYFRGWTLNNFYSYTFPNQLNVIFVGIIPLVAFLLWISHYDRFSSNKLWLPFFLIIVFYLTQSFGPESFNLNIVGMIPIVNLIWFWRFFPALFVFAVSLLSAKVLHDFQSNNFTSVRYRFVGILWLAVLGYFFLLYNTAEEVASLKVDPSVATEFVEWNQTNTVFICLFAFLFSLWVPWVQARVSSKAFRKYWNLSFMVLFFLYCSYNFSKSFYHKQDAFEETPAIAFLKEKLKAGEVFRIYSPDLYFPSTAAGYGVPDIRYMAPVVPKNTTQTIEAVFGRYVDGQVFWDRFEAVNELDGPQTYEHPGFDLLNIRYLLFLPTHPNLPKTDKLLEVFRDENIVIIENTNVQNRYYTVSQWEVLSNRDKIFETIQQNPQALKTKAFLEEKATWPDLQLPAFSPNEDPYRLKNKSSQGYLFNINLESPQVLVIADSFYEGYQASINGQPILAYPVNVGMLGIPLPAGNYQLDVHFEHPFSWLSSSLFLLGSLVTVGLLVWWLYSKKMPMWMTPLRMQPKL